MMEYILLYMMEYILLYVMNKCIFINIHIYIYTCELQPNLPQWKVVFETLFKNDVTFPIFPKPEKR